MPEKLHQFSLRGGPFQRGLCDPLEFFSVKRHRNHRPAARHAGTPLSRFKIPGILILQFLFAHIAMHFETPKPAALQSSYSL